VEAGTGAVTASVVWMVWARGRRGRGFGAFALGYFVVAVVVGLPADDCRLVVEPLFTPGGEGSLLLGRTVVMMTTRDRGSKRVSRRRRGR
jgi:hypothetical protein